jgi:transposase, IS5 family
MAKLLGAGRSIAGRPKAPIRLLAELLHLKHSFNLSDEDMCKRWSERPLRHFFSGRVYHEAPSATRGLINAQ